MPISGVYVIRHEPSGLAYIGSSRDVHKRWRGHQSHLARGKHHNAGLQRAWSAGGQQSLSIAVLEAVSPENRLLLEAEWRWWRWFLFVGLQLFPSMLPSRKLSPELTLPRLVWYRVRRGLAQRDLARLSGVSASTIARIETGHEANPSTARRLAEALKVEPSELMEPEQ